MKVLQHNIWNGCQDDPARLRRLGEWLKAQAFDVVGLNELNGWNRPPGMQALGEMWGYPYSDLLVTEHSPCFVGVLARNPITRVEALTRGFHHAVLHVLIRNVHYCITHLNPFDSVDREREVSILADRVRPIREPLLVMGDLNTLSPLDADEHVARGLASVLKAQSALSRKFLNSGGRINYRPMQQLLEAGLSDPSGSREDAWSVPSEICQDEAHAVRLRLDYILANPEMMRHSPTSIILRDPPTGTLSDHYPVRMTWGELSQWMGTATIPPSG